MIRKATRKQSKTHNTRLVLRTIYHHANISRADIARATALTRPTISSIVSGLLKKNFVIETGRGPSGGGKRPILLNIAEDAHHLLCIDLGSEEFRGAVVNLRGKIIQSISLPTEQRKREAALQLVVDMIDALMALSTAPVLGIGIGTPGLIDPEEGLILRAVNLEWLNLPLRRILAERYQKPVYIANDSHLAALAEYTFGQSRESNNLILIKIGQGIGAGIVLNGQPYYGDGFGAGEIGHVVVAENGLLCSCGNVGCLETFTSTRAILHQAQMSNNYHADSNHASVLATSNEMSWQSIVSALETGDRATREMVRQAGKYLGIGMANLIGSFNIHHLIVAGRVAQFGDLYLAAAEQQARLRVLPALAAKTRVNYASFGSEIVILGCSAMILKHELGVI